LHLLDVFVDFVCSIAYTHSLRLCFLNR
jgi:hypothetical protein